MSIISGVTLEGELYFELHRDDVTGTEADWFLEQLWEEIPGRIAAVWDNVGFHRGPEVATFVWLRRDRRELRRLPPTAPELKPDEGIWDVLKNDRLASYCPTSLEELEPTAKTEMLRRKRSPRRARLALRQTDLPIHELVPAEVTA